MPPLTQHSSPVTYREIASSTSGPQLGSDSLQRRNSLASFSKDRSATSKASCSPILISCLITVIRLFASWPPACSLLKLYISFNPANRQRPVRLEKCGSMKDSRWLRKAYYPRVFSGSRMSDDRILQARSRSRECTRSRRTRLPHRCYPVEAR